MAYVYQKPPELPAGLRLHQNENTTGCSPRVLEALHALDAGAVGFYPAYSRLIEKVAGRLGVSDAHLQLTNGLDEGILAVTITMLRTLAGGTMADALVPEPSFEIYRLYTQVAGGRLIQVPPRAGFDFPLDEMLRALTPATRLVFLSSPNNPTGQLVPREAVRALARAVPAGAVVLLDEAYHEFAGESFLDQLGAFPNVVLGRTFSKAYGLAALRVGCLIGAPDTLAPFRRAVPVYSVNIAAVTALSAALDDETTLAAYVAEVHASREMLYAACDRLGLEYWRSGANFVLVRFGNRVGDVVRRLYEQRIYIRDRSTEPGCAGCARITTGSIAHTARCIAALEQAL